MIFPVFFLLFASPAKADTLAVSTPSVSVTYPLEGHVMATASKAWIIGSVSHPEGHLRINGNEVTPHPLGGFLAYLAVTPGTFTFHCELEVSSQTASLSRTIYVTPPLQPDPTTQTRIDPDPVLPSGDISMRGGDWLIVQMKGTPGGQAEFQIQGKRKKFPMAELNPALGIYKGAYQLQPDDLFESSKIYFYLTGPNKSSIWTTAKGKLTVRNGSPEVAVVRPNGSLSVRTSQDSGSFLFPLPGTKFMTVGRAGAETKVRVSPTIDGWINTSALQMLPLGTPPPHALLHTVNTAAGPDSTSVYFGLTDMVPFQVEPGDNLDMVNIRLFSTSDDTNWMVYNSSDTYVQEMRWRQPTSDTVLVTLRLDPKRRLWGWHASWEAKTLRIELRPPPRLAVSGSVLAGRTIILDPGHMLSQPGKIGPKGLLEKDANLATAKAFELLLLQEGAKPILTRPGDDEVGLSERTRIAWENRGDIFVSIHNNSIPDEANPFQWPHGFEIFYYQPMSLELARAMHRSYLKRIPLPDGRLRYGNLLVARTTEMPSILVESAYMTYPEHEALLLTPAFHNQLAKALLEGLRDFLESERKSQGQGDAKPSSAAKPRKQVKLRARGPR